MKPITITKWLLVLTPVIWILWDILAYKFGGNPSTESAVIDVYGHMYPSLPLMWGYLTAHFFAQKRLPSPDPLPNAVPWFKRPGAWKALSFAAVIQIWDIVHYPSPFTWAVTQIPGPGHGAIEMVLLGIVVGYFVFQMDDETEER